MATEPDPKQHEERVTTSLRREQSDPPLILRGGKVNPDAIRIAYERAADTGEFDDSDGLGRVSFVLQRDLKTRLDKYLTSRIAFMSRSQLQRLIGEGGVTVNGDRCRAATKLRAGDEVTVAVPPPPSTDVLPQKIPIEVLYEDEHLIVLNKPKDIIVHPARTEKSGTLINALAWHFRHDSDTGGELSPVGKQETRPGVVHRLDRNTTGCIVFAKTEHAHWKLGSQFEHRKVDKRYLAVVQGWPEEDGFVIDLPIGPHPSKEKGYREKQVVRRDDFGKPSVTICRVREHYRDHARAVGDQQFALVELELKTGRTHQIRVHLSHEGLPIVGDDMYAGRPFSFESNAPSAAEAADSDPTSAALAAVSTQALHAGLLAFEHPETGDAMVFCAPPPGDMRALIEHLRAQECEPMHVDSTVPLARFGL
ncbi:MAG: RluA family pseudouridine synthase [Planctomycetota bacterium]